MKIGEITENRHLDPSGLLAAAQLVKDFIVTAEVDGIVKKFRVRGMTGPNAAKERFLKHHSNAKVLNVKEEGVAEGKKDACYHKVKSRYKVWPSAYASGALVQCRKKGVKNWGKKKANEGEYDEDDENFNIGDQVKLKPEYEDKPGEIFTITNTSSNGRKFWIADEDGRGWYVYPSQIVLVNDDY